MMINPSSALAFSLFENKGVYAVLIGSGVSRAAKIPTGWDVTKDLVRRVAAAEGIEEQHDWAAWYREKAGKEPEYSEVLDAIAASPDERRSILHNYIEPTPEDVREGRKLPTRAHHAIAWLVREAFVRVILTTNFDRLMENALREAGVEPTVIRSDDDFQGAVPLIHSRCFLVKLHGDYLDSRIENTGEELSTYSSSMNGLLDRILDEHGLVACGWSSDWDPALRAGIRRAPNRRFQFFWASRDGLSALGSDLLQDRRGRMIQIADADSFFDGLQRKVEALSAAQQPNMQSTELTVATAKQYLARPEYRIRLHDLLAQEHGNLLARLGEAPLGVQGQWLPEEFRRRVALYEAATSPLCRVFGTMGRWGDGSELQLANEIMRNHAQQPSVGGNTGWIELQSFPAMLLLYGYGLGLLKAGRHKDLYDWLSQPIATSRQTMEPVVAALFLSAWRAGDPVSWRGLEGLERNKTPLSDHLHTVFADWAKDYLLTGEEFTPLFETFEVLAALTYLSLKTEKAELSSAESETGDRSIVWCPVGRASWDDRHRDAVLDSLQGEDVMARLLAAGFARGDQHYLPLAMNNIRRAMSRIYWT
jgi:hypothetical protein